MKKIGFVMLMLPLFFGLLDAGVKSSEKACPVTKIVVPDEIIAAHDADVLMKMVKKVSGLRWQTKNEEESVRFIFTEKAILKRLQISIIRSDSTRSQTIGWQWKPKDKWWGQIIGNLEIVPDGTDHCYFLESQTLIPENVDVRELILFFPADAIVTSLRFSDQPSEKPM